MKHIIIFLITSICYSQTIKTGVNISTFGDRSAFIKNGNQIISVMNSSDAKDIIVTSTDGQNIITKKLDGFSDESFVIKEGLIKLSDNTFLIINETNRDSRNFVVTKMDYDLNVLGTFYSTETKFDPNSLANGPRFRTLDFNQKGNILISGWITHNQHFVMELDTNLNLLNTLSYWSSRTSVNTHVISSLNHYNIYSSLKQGSTTYIANTEIDNDFNILSSRRVMELKGGFTAKNFEFGGKVYSINTLGRYVFGICEFEDGNIKQITDFTTNTEFIFWGLTIIEDKLVITGSLSSNGNSFYISLNKDLDIVEQRINTKFKDAFSPELSQSNAFAVRNEDTITFFDELPCNTEETDLNFTKTVRSNFTLVDNGINKIEDVPTSNEMYWTNIIEMDFQLIDDPCSANPGPCPASFNYPQTAEDKFSTIQDTRFENGKIVLTDSISENGGAVKYSNPIDLTEPFTTEFEFSISGGYNDFKDGSLPGADGIVLLFSTDTKSVKKVNRNKYGGNLYYTDINNALALEIDTYNNFLLNDPDGNHLAIAASKEKISANHEKSTPLAITSDIPTILNDGTESYICKMDYDGSTLEVTLSKKGEQLPPQIVLNNFKFSDHVDLIQNKFAHIYLMSSTGTSYARHEINNWKLCSDSDEDFISSIESNASNDLIYPNPASDIINFNIDGKKEIKILDLQGRIIYSTTITNNQLNISFLTKGMYFCFVDSESITKIIKE